MAKKQAKVALVEEPLKLDLGCGKNPREGFVGVDSRNFGQKHVVDLRQPWPWKDDSVEEAHCSHFIEHLTAQERIHFVNELYRVLKPDAKCTVIVPHWSSCRAYGDLTHQWPPVSEFWFYYLNKDWRATNAPHNDEYSCHFDCAWGYNMHQAIATRNQEYQQHALTFFKEAAQDLVATFVKK
jgi:hypothetical protein